MNQDSLQHISTFLSIQDINSLRNTSRHFQNIKIKPSSIHITSCNIDKLLPFIREEKTLHSFTIDDDVKLGRVLIAQGVSASVVSSILDNMEIQSPIRNYENSIIAKIFDQAGLAGRIDIIQLYIDRNAIDVFSQDFYMNGKWNLNVIRHLHDSGVNILLHDDFEAQAVGFDRFDTVEYIVDLGAIDSIYYVESPQMLYFLAYLGIPMNIDILAERIVERYEMEIPWTIDFIPVIVDLFPDFPAYDYIEYFEDI